MYKVGLVGVPNAGKSTLFNLLTKSNILTAPYQFSTVDPNKGILRLHDIGLRQLSDAIPEKGVSLPEVEVWDIAGLIEGASNGEGLGNEFLGYIQQCNLLFYVLADASPDELTSTIRLLDSELALFDRKILLKPYEKARRLTRLYPSDVELAKRDRVLSGVMDSCKSGKVILETINNEDKKLIADVELLTVKPKVILVNEFNTENKHYTSNLEDISANFLDLLSIRELSNTELHELGINVNTTNTFIEGLSEEIMKRLGLKRFYTVGHLGVGLWIVPQEATAYQCAQLVHTDIGDELKGVRFATLEDFIIHKSWSAISAKGRLKKYGSRYIPGDKSVLKFEI